MLSIKQSIEPSQNTINLESDEQFDYQKLLTTLGKLQHSEALAKKKTCNYMNKFIAFVNRTDGKCYMHKTLESREFSKDMKTHKNIWKVEFFNELQMKKMYAPHKVSYTEGKTGKIKSKTVFELWASSTERNTYSMVLYDPRPEMQLQKDVFNTYHGLKYKNYSECETIYNKSKSLCDKILEHLYKIMCNQNQTHYNYVLKYLAKKLKEPWIKLQSAIVFSGNEGCGKGIFVNAYGSLFGNQYAMINNSEWILGRFNSVLEGKLLLFFDEMKVDSEDKRDQLKSVITENKIAIEKKFEELKQCESFFNIIWATNHKKVNELPDKSRRFLIISCSDEYSINTEEGRKYFTELKNTMYDNNSEGLKAFQHYLMTKVDLSDFGEGQNPPTSELKECIQVESLNAVKRWMYEIIRAAKYNPILKLKWPAKVDRRALYQDFMEKVGKKDKKRNWSSRMFEYELKSVLGPMIRIHEISIRFAPFEKVMESFKKRTGFTKII